MGNELSQPVIIKRSKVLSVSEADLSSKKGYQDDGGVYIGEPDQTFIDNDSENTSPKTLYFSLNQLNENKMSGEPVIQKVKLCDLAKMYTGRKTESTSPVKPVYCDIINGDDASKVDMCNNHVEKIQKQDKMDETCEKPSLLCSVKDKETKSEEFRYTQAEDIVKRLSSGENGITKEMFDGYVKDSQPIRPPRPSKLAKMRLNVSDFELKGKKYSKPRTGDAEKESFSQTMLENVETIEEKSNVSEVIQQGGKLLNTNELCNSENQSDASVGLYVSVKSHTEKSSQISHDETRTSRMETLSKNLYDETEESQNLHAEIEKESSNIVKETDNSHTDKETINVCMKTTLGNSVIGPKKETLNVIKTETPHIEPKTEAGISHVSVEDSDLENSEDSFLEAENSSLIHAPPLDSAVRDNFVPVCEVKPLRVIASEVVDSSKISMDDICKKGATEICEDHDKHGSMKEDISNDISESENCAATSDITIPTKPDVSISEKVVEDKKEKKNKVTYNTFSRKVAAIWEEYSHGDTIANETESVKTSKKEPKVKKSNSFWKYLTYHETPKKSKERQRRKNTENGTLNSSDFRKVCTEGKDEVQKATSSEELKPNVNRTPVMDFRDEESVVIENEANVDASDDKSNSTSNIAETSLDLSCRGNGHLPETFPQGSDALRESSTDKNVKDIESSDTIVQCKINGTESGRFEDGKNLDYVVNVLPPRSESTLGSEISGASEIQGNMEPKNAKEKKERKTTKRNNSISAKISDFLFQDFRRRSSNKVDKRPDKIRPERRRRHSSTGSKHNSSSIEENTIQEEVSESDRTSKTEKVSGISKLLSLSNMNLSTTKEKKAKRRKSSSTMDIAGVGVNDVRPSDEPRQRPKSIFDEDIDVTIDEQKDDVVSLSSLSSENEDEGKHKVQVHVPNEIAGSLSNEVKRELEEPSVGKEEVEVSLQCTECSILESSPESENKLSGESDLKEDSDVRLRVIGGDSREDNPKSSGSEDVLKSTEPITDLDDDESLPQESSVKGACSDKNDSELASNENEETEQTVNQKMFVSSYTLSLSSPLYNLISEGEEVEQRTNEQRRTEDTKENDESGVHETVKVPNAEHEDHVTSCDTTSYDYEVVSPPSTEKSNNCDRNLERFGLMLAERNEQISSDTKGNISPSSDTDIVRTLSLQELHVQMHVYDEIENKRPIIYRRFSDRDERDVIRTAPDGTDGKHGKKKKRSRSFSDLFKKSNRRKAQWRAKRKIRDDSARKIADEVSPSAASPTSSIVHM